MTLASSSRNAPADPSGGRQTSAPAGAQVTTEGTVQVRADLPAPIADAWKALTEPGAFGRWFGDLSAPLRPGGSTRIEFGDGDFFDVEAIQFEPPVRLYYAWRFQGIGPLDRITWNLTPLSNGSRLTVTDEEPDRPSEGVSRMREGWLDFLGRLQRFLATGEAARYDWSREIEASIELDADPETIQERWLSPTDAPVWLDVLNPGGAATFADVRSAARSLAFSLREPDWLASTSCHVSLHPRQRGTLVAIHHAGWDEIGESALEQRRVYCGRWVQALRHLRERARRYTA